MLGQDSQPSLREKHLLLAADVIRIQQLPPFDAVKAAPKVLERFMRLTGDMVDELETLRQRVDVHDTLNRIAPRIST